MKTSTSHTTFMLTDGVDALITVEVSETSLSVKSYELP